MGNPVFHHRSFNGAYAVKNKREERSMEQERSMSQEAHFLMTLTQLEAALLCVMEVAEDAIDTISIERAALVQACIEERKKWQN